LEVASYLGVESTVEVDGKKLDRDIDEIALEVAERIVRMAIDNFENRGTKVMIPKQKAPIVAGFGVESVEYHLDGSFRGSYYTLNDNIINGRIRGIGGVVGCNNVRTRHNDGHLTVVKELIKNDRPY